MYAGSVKGMKYCVKGMKTGFGWSRKSAKNKSVTTAGPTDESPNIGEIGFTNGLMCGRETIIILAVKIPSTKIILRARAQCCSTSTRTGKFLRCHGANFHHSFVALRKRPPRVHCASNCQRHGSTVRTMGSLHSISLWDMQSKPFCWACDTTLAFSPVSFFLCW